MHIQQAKEQVAHAIAMYLAKDVYGAYCIPPEHQRPIFLYGVPGVGKTAIIQQAAAQASVGFLSYSMTHHTRQSILGLPRIMEKTYGDVTFEISTYTMSEIIAAVYDYQARTGLHEGILFLDEINCVSETLAPSMLQFLQYKTFGNHRLPDGWIVAAAGNPPEYNHSVNAFDVATWDRVKCITITPEYQPWRDYARQARIHHGIISYLDHKPQSFFRMEHTVDGSAFVTPRSWENLSYAMRLSEQMAFPIDHTLISQYLHDPEIAQEFAQYYALLTRYQLDTDGEAVFEGHPSSRTVSRMRDAPFDERIAWLDLMISQIHDRIAAAQQQYQHLADAGGQIQLLLQQSGDAPALQLAKHLETLTAQHQRRQAAQIETAADLAQYRFLHGLFQGWLDDFLDDAPSFWSSCQADFQQRQEQLGQDFSRLGSELHHLFAFVESAFGDGQELLLLMSELTSSPVFQWYLSQFGSADYARYRDNLLFTQQREQVMQQMGKGGADP